jgi:hypothetical protein
MKNNNESLTGLSLIIYMKDRFNYKDYGEAFAALPDEIKDKTRTDAVNELKDLLGSQPTEIHVSRLNKLLVQTARMKTKEEIVDLLKTVDNTSITSIDVFN